MDNFRKIFNWHNVIIKVNYYSNHSNILTTINFEGWICGDKCLTFFRRSTCTCGDEQFSSKDSAYYCCTPKNVTCTKSKFNNNVICPKGKKLPWNTFCKDQNQCPISTRSVTALTTNCSDVNNQYCPNSDRYTSKICTDSIKSVRPIDKYCEIAKACPRPKGGNTYKQCFNQ